MNNNCSAQEGLQLLALCWAVIALKDTADGATQPCCLEHLTSLHSLYHGYIELCTNKQFFSGLYKLTAFLGSSQFLLRSLLPTLKKMF